MALLTVVEASSLSGMPPDAIRELIERGRLPARAVRLDEGPMYLIEETRLRPLLAGGSVPAAPDHVQRAAEPSSPLEQALASVNEALARLRTESAVGAALPPSASAGPDRPGGRAALGLSEGELRRLAERIDRLMTPAAPSVSTPASRERGRRGWWRRLLGRH